MLPTVLASSVIRSTHRGDSHGGIYRVDLETGENVKMLDWNTPGINWDGHGGDRGIRGLAFWGDTLYAVAGNALFSFKKEGDVLKLVDEYRSPYLKLTHESWRHQDKLYICSGGTDSILVFDLVKRQWTTSFFHHKSSGGTREFDPVTGRGYETLSDGGFMHLDSVYADDNAMWYCGAYTDGVWRFDFVSGQTTKWQLQIPDTHNARPYKGGFLYNLSRLSKTVFEYGGIIIDEWKTPLPPMQNVTNTGLPADHAALGYTRGMVTYNNYVIVGTSPASIHVYELGSPDPVKSITLSDDLRNSICGMCLYEWS